MTRMLVTRPEPDAGHSAARLAALGIAAVACPLLVRRTLDTSLPEAKGFAAMALTSVNALRALDERGALARYTGLPVYCVGDTSAEAARSYGFARVTSASGRFGDLVDVLARAQLEGPVFHPGGRHQAGDLARALAGFGVMVVGARVYEMVQRDALPEQVADDLRAGRFDAALFYSRRTSEAFVNLVDAMLEPDRRRLGMLCLSEQVAEPLIAAHFVRISLADYPSEEAMMATALAFARAQNAP